jgi:hypothetical protein
VTCRLSREASFPATSASGYAERTLVDFEHNQMDLLRCTRQADLAKLMVIDFMLAQGNDWFTVPLELETGSFVD